MVWDHSEKAKELWRDFERVMNRKDEKRALYFETNWQTDVETLWALVGVKSCVRCLSVKTIPRVPSSEWETRAKTRVWLVTCDEITPDTGPGPRWMTFTKYGCKQFPIVQGRLWLGAQVTSGTMVRSVFQFNCLQPTLLAEGWCCCCCRIARNGSCDELYDHRDGTGMKINIGHTCKEHLWPAWSRVTCNV